MFENLKRKIGHFVTRKKYLQKTSEQISYNKVVSNAREFFIIMPTSDADFNGCLEIIKYFLIHKKTITIFIPEHKNGYIPEKEKFKFISYLHYQETRFHLPEKKLIQRLQPKAFDVVIDLNRFENVFCSAVTNIVKSKVIISFSKNASELYYNLQIVDNNTNPEASYRNFLNYLRMF